jgi:exodeoxyribonuclease VII small subunit
LAKKASKKEASDQPSFEAALDGLEGIVRRLEEGEIGLNEALAEYEGGVKLLRQCYDLLEKAERRIELLSGVDADGNPITTPMEDESADSSEKVPGRRNRPAGNRTPPKRADRPADENDMDSSAGLF